MGRDSNRKRVDSRRNSEGEKSVLWKGSNNFSKDCDRVILQETNNSDTEEKQ